MTTLRRIQVTIQTDRVVTIRRRANVRLLCPECGCDVDVVDLAQVEALMGKSLSQIRNGADANRWHCLEGPGGTALICLESLLESAVSSGIFDEAPQDRNSVDGLGKKLSFGRSQSADLPGTEWVSGIDNRQPKHFNTDGHGE